DHTAEKALDQALRQFITIIDNNHGVREDNLKQMLIPIGVRINLLDATWITNLDNFGRARGDTAHNTISVIRTIDPRTELDRIQKLIIPGLEKLDEVVLKISK